MNRLTHWWHRRQVERLTRKLNSQTLRCQLLDTAANNFCTSYYTDQAIEAQCRRFEINSALQYHKDKITP